MPQKLTTKIFIQKAIEAHGNEYQYLNTNYINKRTKIEFLCKIHGKVLQLPMNHLRIGCGYCSRGSDNTYSFVSKAKEKWGDKYDYSITEFKSNKHKIKFKCSEHGEVEQYPKDHLENRCPRCTGRREVTKNYNPKIALKKLKKIHGNKYKYPNLSFEYVHDFIPIICPYHGEFTQRFYAHLAGQTCPMCANKNRGLTKEHDVFIRQAKKRHGNKYDYSNTYYINKKTKIKYNCPTHGEVEQYPNLHLRSGCYYCAGRGPSKYTTEEYIKAIKAKHGDFCDYSKVEIGDKGVFSRIKIVCPKHGLFRVTACRYLRSEYPCPKCANESSTSKAEEELYQYIKSIFNGEIIRNDRDALKGREIDIYIPKLKIGFEYHGLYYHREEIVGQGYHHTKCKIAEKYGIRLIQIFEHEWSKKQKTIKSIVRSKIGANKKIHARKTKVVHLTAQESKSFLSENHLQGESNSSVRIGLIYNNDIVSCMTFGKSRFNKKYDWELIRYCSKSNINVIGGASKMFKYFYNKHIGSMISYADRRYSNGNLYVVLGFNLVNKTAPGYFYYNLKNGEIKNRMSCQKHKLINMQHYNENLSEYQIMTLNDYDRVWDAGNLVFAYDQ